MTMQKSCGRVLVLLLTLAIAACDAGEGDAKGEHRFDLSLKGEATPSDAGLPAYPGAKPYLQGNQSSSGANIGFDTPLFGFKVAAMNFETPDSPDQVAKFYKEALSGDVIDCSDAADRKKTWGSDDRHDSDFVCDVGDSRSEKTVYKAGTKTNQRIVAVKPYQTGTRFSLVHLDFRK